ncbi:MAG: hypothetical protein IKC03_04975 [Oscillospiraceae bacterium]|nr:hypothetical protein [Oscillospiraceae bacterium]
MSNKKEKEVEEMTLSDVQAQIAKMLADAQAQAEKIVADAVAQAKSAAGTVDDAERERQKAEDWARGEELVEVKLFKDTGRYKDDVFISCNGETIAIQRGERVKIKRKFAEILDHSEHQDYETARLIERSRSSEE